MWILVAVLVLLESFVNRALKDQALVVEDVRDQNRIVELWFSSRSDEVLAARVSEESI